ncbi:hypothetical protein AHAS_Ahas11G0147700 [Arachis hypogaea]
MEVIENHEDSLPENLMEDHAEEREKFHQESPHLNKADNCIEEGLIEPPMQEALDEENTPTITQPSSLEFKEVKATNNNTEERIVTQQPLNISRKKEGSTTNNPTPGPPARKLNQAIDKRKLARKKPRKGALTGSSLPLSSFLLTNWKKRKKVISYRNSFNLLEGKIHHHVDEQRKDMEPNNDDETEETNGLQEVVLFSE